VTASLDDIRAYIARHTSRHVDELTEFLSIPSVSALRQHAPDMLRCAGWLAGTLRAAGLEHVEMIQTDGPPLVYGDWLHAAGAPTVLCYGHYDVQPVDPIDAWASPPFEPTVRDGRIYARGATDDKGQFYTHIKAIEAHLACRGRLPVNIRLIVEGEEEVGGTSLHGMVTTQPERLAADLVVNSDSAMFAPGIPSVPCALRGVVYFELAVHGPGTDLHSGAFGGTVANPALALAGVLGSLTDGRGRVTIPGFYDEVAPLTARERAAIAALPFDEAAYARQCGVTALFGEPGYSTLERQWARPTLDIHGLESGFVDEGSKTVIPAVARAKLSMRLVPEQRADVVARQFKDFVAAITPPGVRVDITQLYSGDPWLASSEQPPLQAAARAIAYGFGTAPVFTREGGSNPVVRSIEDALGAHTVMLAFGLPDENAHAPNEHLDLGNFQRGIVTAARFYQEVAALPAKRSFSSD
jgi:acetylornithine deacetylase/succinyl-diaminopimelate desuccinylase-like protein